jgi:hypothetical protein
MMSFMATERALLSGAPRRPRDAAGRALSITR